MADDPKLGANDVIAAKARIAEWVVRTPLLETHIRGHRIWLKCENQQTGGAFKLRGATNRLLQLSEDERGRGVVAFSSGNHAQGVAIAAKRLGIAATIVMPTDAPIVKVEGTRSQEAKIVFYDRQSESREAIASKLAQDSGATVVPSFDDPAIVAGQGTVGLEIVEQLGRSPRQILIPCGGGGLAAGVALACPDSGIVIVEPDGWDDMSRSLSEGRIVPVGSHAPTTICDALQTPIVSPMTFAILAARRASALSVSDRDVEHAIRWAWNQHRLRVEPGGAVALAAVILEKVAVEDDLVVILSGGNIDLGEHSRILLDGAPFGGDEPYPGQN
ncbi:threonine/serine dehydratase [Sphingomonas sp. LY160]|uniref:threonine ammonia-lyase n=1 Tax=Sphingomonas sp. LY160 TaxID=3095342 RepID=UPI002ADEEC30|nr:threonine/serine dehydratase [Sphingomonas sp. LY160]MEA1071176.1 threonine/serine dehydratase [Sphingomonas sp. LY160]